MDAKDRDLPPKDPGDRPEPAGEAVPPVVRVEKPRIEEEEMGGEAPCQLHNVWDVDAEE